jgi:glucose-6-phosphate isomerase
MQRLKRTIFNMASGSVDKSIAPRYQTTMNIVFPDDISTDEYGAHWQLLQTRNQGWLDMGTLKKPLEQIVEYTQNVQGKYTDIVVLGIGGSMLGPKMLHAALGSKNGVRVHCVDNIDPWVIAQLDAALDYAHVLFLVQTKSGGTPETIAQYEFFRHRIEQNGLQPIEHMVFVTDPAVGLLRRVGLAEGFVMFDIPPGIGGRFSVLTPVGILIAALIGHDIFQYIAGAEQSLAAHRHQAYQLAAWQYSLTQKNVVLMPYSSQLSMFSHWYVQLLSESIGKTYDRQGTVVHTGLTPIPALGATDQHSQLQLFKEGPDDKQYIFIQVKDFQAQPMIPQIVDDSLAYISGRSFAELMHAEQEGTRQSLAESGRPLVSISIDRVDEHAIGALCMFFELSVAFLGEILDINAFDQPGVERSKVLTKELMSQH